MSNKKTIGIATWPGTGNYGTTLQAFALIRFLSNQGYKCKLINEFDFNYFGKKQYIKEILRKTGLLDLKEELSILKKANSKKYFKLRKFLRAYVPQEFIETYPEYHRLLNEYDLFCVGSDQVWNAYHDFKPFFFLDFAKKTKRISYATSMGTKDFPEEYKNTIKDLLLKFDHISLRETTGKEAVSKLTGRKDVRTVLDPTFLLTASEWKDVAKDANIEIHIPEKYMLVYLIGNNPYYSKQVEDVKKQIGIDNVVVIPALENPSFEVSGATVYRFVAISEFIYLLEYASWVCTDSFHATALSINLNKNFTEFLRFKDSDKGSQNSRIYDILRSFGLEDRLYNRVCEIWGNRIDFTRPTEILNTLRKDSSEWLLNAIEN
ncbi:MAG: polysaccharide pyruvyl transferase family protein [Prevotella sp.]|jgi:hypothetical protein|nr:polysaccharide pyruvyl transferase family protein [Prevotella sp.]